MSYFHCYVKSQCYTYIESMSRLTFAHERSGNTKRPVSLWTFWRNFGHRSKTHLRLVGKMPLGCRLNRDFVSHFNFTIYSSRYFSVREGRGELEDGLPRNLEIESLVQCKLFSNVGWKKSKLFLQLVPSFFCKGKETFPSHSIGYI